jgi:hypothetical protein
VQEAGQELGFKPEKGGKNMSSRIAKLILVYGATMILVGVLALVESFVELSPWVWSGALAVAGLGALVLFLTDRSNGLMLLAAWVLGAIAGLVALVPSEILQDEAIAVYVLSAIALPFVGVFVRKRAWWWALIPAYSLLAVVGVIVLAELVQASDELISAYVLLAVAAPFFVVHARNRKRVWALISGGISAAIGLSLGTWLSWPALRSSLSAGAAADYAIAFGLFFAGAWLLARVLVRRGSAG